MNSVPAFSLKDVSGNEREFSGGNQSLVCFIKEDCPPVVKSCLYLVRLRVF